MIKKTQPGPMPMTRRASGRFRWLFLGVLLGLVVAVIIVATVLWTSRDSQQAEPTAEPSTSPAPTWDMTAQPVPNEYGSYGTFGEDTVAENWVTEFYSWSRDEPQPAGMLSRVRDWTADGLFEAMVSEHVSPPAWIEDHGEIVARTVKIVDSECTVAVSTSDESCTVRYQLTDTHASGISWTSETRSVTVTFDDQPVSVPSQSGGKSINEIRVSGVEDGAASDNEEGT